uniref:TRAF interacting protein with forkhead associated domain n=1 Tax=Strigops habroptila TaxID=2489341 RepID=A0A672UZ52_STRHB
MTSFEEAETEETVTCLHMTFYHPCQEDKMMFRCLNFCKREQVRADEMAKFGRDSNVCHYNFMDARVSRIHFSLALGFLSSILACLKSTLERIRTKHT